MMPLTWVVTACGSIAGPGVGNRNDRLFMVVAAVQSLFVVVGLLVAGRDLELELRVEWVRKGADNQD